MELSNRQHVSAMIPCPQSYGIAFNPKYSRGKHWEDDMYTDPFDGEMRVCPQLNWMVKKGDLLTTDEQPEVEQQ